MCVCVCVCVCVSSCSQTACIACDALQSCGKWECVGEFFLPLAAVGTSTPRCVLLLRVRVTPQPDLDRIAAQDNLPLIFGHLPECWPPLAVCVGVAAVGGRRVAVCLSPGVIGLCLFPRLARSSRVKTDKIERDFGKETPTAVLYEDSSHLI